MFTQNPNPNPSDGEFTVEQEKLIKNSFTELDKKLGITSETPDYLKYSFEQKLGELVKPKRSFLKGWGGLATSMVAAFSLGILISRFAMMPATVSTRSIGNEGAGNQFIAGQEYVAKSVDNPKDYAFQLISLALEANMEVEIIQASGKYVLYIKPFRPKEKSQEKVRAFLGVNPDFSGTVNATIRNSKE